MYELRHQMEAFSFDHDIRQKSILAFQIVAYCCMKVQANFDMSNLLNLKTPPMSKWCSIPEHFTLCFIVFRPCLCQTRLSRNLGYIEVISIPVKQFSISFTTTWVEVKSVFRKCSLEKKKEERWAIFAAVLWQSSFFFLLLQMGKNIKHIEWPRH